MQNNLLEKYFSQIKNSDIYSSFYADINDYKNAPVLYKDKLRELLDINFDLLKEKKGVYLVRSGGSTQKPLVFPVDIKENLLQRELLAEQLKINKIFTEKTIALNLFSYKNMYRTAAILDDILERTESTTLALNSSASFELMYATVKEFKPNLILGTPSKLTLFANYLLENKKQITIKNLLFGGEYLQPSQQALFSKAFNTTQIYSLYGSAETGIWAWANYSEKNIHFQFLKEISIEILNPDEDGFGPIMVSNILRKRFPIFRYNMGDIGKIITKNDTPFLVLKSREIKSFSLHSESYFLTDFDTILKGIDTYQIQISLNSSTQIKIDFLLIKKYINTEQLKTLKIHIHKNIHEILDINEKHTELNIQFVSENEFYLNPTTSKTPTIIDYRD